MRDYKKDAQDLRRIAKFQNCFECFEGERTEGSCSSRCTLSKAADAIEELLAENKAIKQSNKDAAMRNKLLCDEISRMKEKVPKWVSVEERLPPVYKNVLSCDKYGLVKENYMISDKSWSVGYHITHWMPLPTPPKGVE